MLPNSGILYFTTLFHGFEILPRVHPFVRMLHIYYTFIIDQPDMIECGNTGHKM